MQEQEPQVKVIEETLSDGTTVFVALDTTIRGCMAQGATREEALESLKEARAMMTTHRQPSLSGPKVCEVANSRVLHHMAEFIFHYRSGEER
jgi:predicted RNase H-like HicB family nuclease